MGVRNERVYSSDPVTLVSDPIEGARARIPRRKRIHGTHFSCDSSQAVQTSKGGGTLRRSGRTSAEEVMELGRAIETRDDRL
jgi:hypothetical protein